MSHQVQQRSDQMSLRGAKLLSECTTGGLCCRAGSGLFHVHADRIIFTLVGYIFGKCGQGGRPVPVMVLQFLAFMTQAMATRSPRSEIKHQADVVEVWIGNSWVISLVSAPVTRYVINIFCSSWTYCTVALQQIRGNATVRENQFW